MLPNLTNQYISYSMAVFSANEIRTFFSKVSRLFLEYKNDSKKFYELQRSILTFTELPHIFEKSNHANDQGLNIFKKVLIKKEVPF